MNIEDGIPELPIPTPKSAGHDTPRSGGGFTPGPWVVDPNCRGDIQTADGREVCSLWSEEDRGKELTIHGELIPDHECDPNARLIAAAPDLLEALTVLHDAWFTARDPVAVTRASAKARAAISKALGTSPEGLASMAMGGGDSTESQSQPCGARDLQPRCPQAQHFDGGASPSDGSDA